MTHQPKGYDLTTIEQHGIVLGPPYPGPNDHANGLIPPQPSMYDRKDRHSDNPDLVFVCQLQGLLLGHLMEMAGIYELEMDSLTVAKNRMRRIDVSETETGGIRAVRQS